MWTPNLFVFELVNNKNNNNNNNNCNNNIPNSYIPILKSITLENF